MIARRAPLKRSAPPRRTSWLRPGKYRSKYKRRERDLGYLGWLKTQRCVLHGVSEAGPCAYRDGVSEADHAGRRAYGRRCHDSVSLPHCWGHHGDHTNYRGFYDVKRWPSKHARAEWLIDQAGEYRARYLAKDGRL